MAYALLFRPFSHSKSKPIHFVQTFLGYRTTPWPSRIKVFGDQWVNQWCGVSKGVTKVNSNSF